MRFIWIYPITIISALADAIFSIWISTFIRGKNYSDVGIATYSHPLWGWIGSSMVYLVIAGTYLILLFKITNPSPRSTFWYAFHPFCFLICFIGMEGILAYVLNL